MVRQPQENSNLDPCEGILLVNKPPGKTSFSLVSALRKRLGVKKIGHAGTLDPFATGVMVMLIGKTYTRISNQFLLQDKEYLAELKLGIATDTHDLEGQTILENSFEPSLDEVMAAISHFQGEIEQIPPMFSAKKINGKKLYEMARKGQVVERAPVKITTSINIISYTYPSLIIRVACSKGTYIRSLAHDIGMKLSCGAHLTALQRLRSGPFQLHQCMEGEMLFNPDFDRKACTALLKWTVDKVD